MKSCYWILVKSNLCQNRYVYIGQYWLITINYLKGLGNIEDICFPGGFGFLDFNGTNDIETFPRLLLLINSSAHAKADTLEYTVLRLIPRPALRRGLHRARAVTTSGWELGGRTKIRGDKTRDLLRGGLSLQPAAGGVYGVLAGQLRGRPLAEPWQRDLPPSHPARLAAPTGPGGGARNPTHTHPTTPTPPLSTLTKPIPPD